jgi:hypothetical protein
VRESLYDYSFGDLGIVEDRDIGEREKREGLESWRDGRLRSGEGIKIVEVKGECI